MTSPVSVIQVQQIARKRKHSDDMDFYDEDGASSPKSSCSPSVEDDRRAHHNELERRRRDHIKDHFMNLKEAIPLLEGEKSSRALILKRAVEYIEIVQNKLSESQKNLDLLRQKNDILESKLKEQVATPIAQTVSPVPQNIGYPSTSTALPPLHQVNTVSAPINIPTTMPATPSNSFVNSNLSFIPEIGIRTTPQDILNLTQALLAQKVSQAAQQPKLNQLNLGGFDVQAQLLCNTYQTNYQRQLVSAIPF